MAQEYISQLSEVIEGRVSKKLSKKFSRMESRSLGDLYKLGKFLLNPRFRTGFGTVPGTTRNGDSGNREPSVDRSPNDPCTEAMISSHYSLNLNSSEVEEQPHMVQELQKTFAIVLKWRQEFKKRIPTAPLELHQENRRLALQVSHNFAVRTPLQQMKQTRSC